METKELVYVLKKLAQMAEDGLSGHMYDALVAIRKEALEAAVEAERGE